MGTIQSFFRHATPDFPLSVSYFAPYHIPDAPALTEISHRMQIMLVTAGQVEAYADSKSYLLNPGDIFILRPHEINSTRSTSLDTRYINLSFKMDLFALPPTHFFQKEFVAPMQEGMLIPPLLVRPGDEPYDALLHTLRRLDINKEGSSAYTAELFSIAVDLCTTLLPYCTTVTPKKTSRKVSEDAIYACLNYIQEHFSEKITLQELASFVHLQPNYLCALFKERTGRTIFEHITRLRINSAAKLLRSTSLPVNQIAEQCGFSSISFFNRKFTHWHKCSPTEYRKQFKERNLPKL